MPDYDDLTQEERELLPLIAHLQQIYNTQAQDEQDLGAIGEQLAHTRLQLLTPIGAEASPPLEREDLGRILPAFALSSQGHRREFRSLKVLAATLVVSLLTGSLVITLLLARSHHSTGSTASMPPVSSCPASTAALPMYVDSIHMVSQTIGWGVVQETRKDQNGVVVNLPEEIRLIHTIDSGCHWKTVKTFSFPAAVIVTPFFLSETMAWIASENHLVHTADAGKTWQTDDLPLAAGESAVIRDLTFLDNDTGWLIANIQSSSALPKSGSAAVLFHTSDGGHHWSQLLRVSPENISTSPWNSGSRLSFLTATEGWMTGDALLQTLDGGKTWHPQPLPPPPGATSGFFLLDPPRFFSARDGILPASSGGVHPGFFAFVTHDGGRTWQSQPFVAINYNEVARRMAPPGSGSFALPLRTPSPSFTDMQFGWVGYPRLEEFTTRDGGKHWQRLDLSMLPKGVGQLEFANKDVGWALVVSTALTSQLYRTTDGGKTWTPLALSVT